MSNNNIKTYIQELQPIMELLNEGKFFGAESICDIVAPRYFDGNTQLHEECRCLFSDIKNYIKNHDNGTTSLDDIRQQYQELKEKYL